ncbi:hypothetical protein DFJ77DRAFT_550982 [Powellomyces hirtus]|nr:hypothetical protein DFJ77DRAFT_550982 [Powellomyces hirtus]
MPPPAIPSPLSQSKKPTPPTDSVNPTNDDANKAALYALGLTSPALRLNETVHDGRYLLAKTNLPPNTLLLSLPAPYAHALFDSHKKRVCAVCLAFNDQGPFHLHCRNCDQLYLCSPNCLATLLAQGHHVVCAQLRKLATFKAPQHEKSVLKLILMILFKRHVERGRHLHTSLRPTEQPATSITDPWHPMHCATAAPSSPLPATDIVAPKPTRPIPGQTSFHTSSLPMAPASPTSANNPAHSYTPPPPCSTPPPSHPAPPSRTYKDIENLQSHYLDWPQDDRVDWRKTKNFIARLLDECHLLEDGDRDKLTGDADVFLLALVSRIESNGFGLWSPRKENCMGRAVFPEASYFNHSCNPNSICEQTGPQMTIRTTRAVPRDAPLTISYIDSNAPLHARRSHLAQDYFFHCKCERCEAEEYAAANGSPATANAQRIKVTYERSFTQGANAGPQSPNGDPRQKQPRNARGNKAGARLNRSASGPAPSAATTTPPARIEPDMSRPFVPPQTFQARPSPVPVIPHIPIPLPPPPPPPSAQQQTSVPLSGKQPLLRRMPLGSPDVAEIRRRAQSSPRPVRTNSGNSGSGTARKNSTNNRRAPPQPNAAS